MRSLLRVPCALAVLLLSAATAVAQEVRVERPAPFEVDVVGGAGPAAWRLRYGTNIRLQNSASVVSESPGRAYFTHGSWLRLIDTTTGVVIGRWRFPNLIEAVTLNGAAVDVRFQLPPWSTAPNMTVRFDPAVGRPPDFDVGALVTYRAAEWEAWELLRVLAPGPDPWATVIRNAASHVAVLEDMVRRDPMAPMLRLALAKLLRDAGDPRAPAAFADIFQVASNDFAEWFALSSILARMTPEPAYPRDAYERALRDFIRRDRDPRLVDTLIPRLVLYPSGINLLTASDASADAWRRTFPERIYTLAPTSEGTDRAWAFHADALARAGDTAAAAVWQQRAEASARESLFLATVDFQLRHGRSQLLALAALLAALVFVIARQVKYAAQRRMHAVAAMRKQEPLFSTLLGPRYWSRRDRWSLLAIVSVGWLAMGYSWTYASIMFRSAALPLHAGMLSAFQDYDREFPASPERDLIHALALQHDGRLEEAERQYRALPQFAESWNNLGVMQSRAGNIDQSRQLFSRALEVDPTLPEAVLNSSGQASTPATQTFRAYAADLKMIAVPARARLLRGYLGPVWTARYLRMLTGPLEAFRSQYRASYLNAALMGPTMVGGAALGVLLVLAIVWLAFVPYQDVSVPSGRVTAWLELIIPGTSLAWRWAAVPVLLAWVTALLALILLFTVGSPYLLIRAMQPGTMRAFGYPAGIQDLNPPATLLIAVVLVVLAVNAVVIRSASRAREAEETGPLISD